MEPIVSANTDLVPGESNNAWISGPKHLDFGAVAKSEFA
jgi:hypothetical protein